MSQPHVLFLVSALKGFNVDHGGHYYSCATLVRALDGHVRTSVLSVGHFPPGALHTLPDAIHVNFARLPTPGTWAALVHHVRRLQPTHLHAFDLTSWLVARLLGLRFRLPVVITKPGGADKEVPRCHQVVVFSRENLDDLKRRYAGRDMAIHLIPNRVLPVHPDPERIAAVRARIGNDHPVFLRIARFSRQYLPSIRQTATLARDLCAAGYPCHALIIGTPQSQWPEVATEVHGLAGPHVTVLDEPMFTRSAAELIPVADFVIGTGRGFMEAAMQGRILMTTVAGLRYPLIVDESNFENVFQTNFSPRNVVPDASDETTYATVRALLGSAEARARVQAFAREVGQRFDVRTAIPCYLEIYKDHRPTPFTPGDLLKHSARVARLLLPRPANPGAAVRAITGSRRHVPGLRLVARPFVRLRNEGCSEGPSRASRTEDEP